jgi:hypothetical protein
MAHRTTLLLDDETRQAARDLAGIYGCSVSEAIRRAVVRQRGVVLGVSAEQRSRRRAALDRAFELFDGHDADAEIARLKDEDDGF